MARITLASQLAAANAKIAALEARLVVATTVYRNQRAHIAELESALNTRGCIATPVAQAVQPKAIPTPTVTTYRDGAGQLWERTRYSATRSISRPVAGYQPADESFEDISDDERLECAADA
jgi:hypothetical protein